MIEVKREFSAWERWLFGPLFALFVGIICLIMMRRFGWYLPAWTLVAAATCLIAIYYLIPSWQTAIYRGWLLSVAPIGFIISHVLLALVFYLLITPIGWLMKAVGYDPMSRTFDASAASYWVARRPSSDSRSYFRQF
jgi:hypothetical protein